MKTRGLLVATNQKMLRPKKSGCISNNRIVTFQISHHFLPYKSTNPQKTLVKPGGLPGNALCWLVPNLLNGL